MRYALCSLLLLVWYPGSVGQAEQPVGERPPVVVQATGGRVVLSLDTAYTWQQPIVERLSGGRWRITWAASDGERGGVWSYAMTIDAPPGPDPGPDPDPPGPDPPNPWTPVERWKATVGPLLEFDLAENDATRMADMYGAAAAQIAAGAIGTTLELRQWIIANGKELGLQGKYPGLADSMNSIMAEALGLDVKPLNAERANEFLVTLAWACWEAGQ